MDTAPDDLITEICMPLPWRHYRRETATPRSLRFGACILPGLQHRASSPFAARVFFKNRPESAQSPSICDPFWGNLSTKLHPSVPVIVRARFGHGGCRPWPRHSASRAPQITLDLQ